jgi:hypothetical protein
LGLAVAVTGGFVVMAGVFLLAQSMFRAHAWKRATARVLGADLDSTVDSDNSRVYFGVYKLQYDAGGELRQATMRSSVRTTVEADVRTRLAKHPPGTEDEIFYNPANPAEVTWDVGSSTMGLSLGFGVIGLTFLIVGLAIWYGSQPAEW